MANKPSDNLKNILQGNYTDVKVDPDSIVIQSDRIRNDILQALRDEYRKEKVYTDEQILNIIIGLDQVVEEGLLTKSLLETVKKDPKIIENYLNNLKK